MAKSDIQKKLEDMQMKTDATEAQSPSTDKYRPNKRMRKIRRQVYERFYWLRDEPLRAEAESDWETADKEYGMVIPEIDPDDWQSHLQLPDAFAAIQSQAQETIERKSRPSLRATEESDEPIEHLANSVINYNMDNTGYDYQYSMAKLAASIRGTAFLMDYWRTDKRIVKDPVSINKETGEVTYQDKEIIDFDDDYTEWVPNEFIYIDEKAKHMDEAVDGFRREIVNIDEFHRIYDNKPGFVDAEYVIAGGDTSNRSYFQLPQDITAQDVEVLHYYNRSTDSYWVVANNIAIHDGPLPWKHKELPFVAIYQYRVPGRFWGMGIPKVIHFLSEERKSIRNLNMDRQKIIIGGAFLHNSSFDIQDEDTILSPGRIISVDTNGQSLDNAIRPVQLGDVPASYFRTEEILLEDIRRAHGIDDRIQGVNVGGTATEAAILKESSLKRVNLISISAEMDAVVRIGRLKWSNIQFFYGTPRIERIVENNEEREKKKYRTISAQGRKFSIVDDNGRKQLKMEDVKGASALSLKPDMAKYLEGDFDISVDSDIFSPISKAIEQTKKTEMFTVLLGNPATIAKMDIEGALEDVLRVNNISPERWLKAPGSSKQDMQQLAEAENMIMAAGQPLSGTENATEEHTLIHLLYTKTQEYQQLPQENQQLITDHIMQEHDNNPATGSIASLLGQYGLGGQQSQVPGMNTPFSQPNPLAVGAGAGGPKQSPVADLQPTNFSTPPGQ